MLPRYYVTLSYEETGGKYLMQGDKISDATVFVIFGGGGDLTWRKLAPALYSLFLDGVYAGAIRDSGSRPQAVYR